MTETKCSTFPLIALPIGATDEEKRLLGERLIPSAPRYLRWKVELALDQLSLEDLVHRLEFCRQQKDGCCHHAAWAALLSPSLFDQYNAALRATAQEDHDLILTTLPGYGEESHERNVVHFLEQVTTDGLDYAVTNALEFSRFPIFGENLSLDHPNAELFRAFLEKTSKHGRTYLIRFLSMQWLHCIAPSKRKRMELISRNLEDRDPHIRCLAALQLSKFNTNENKLIKLLWDPLQDRKWQTGFTVPRSMGSWRIGKLATKTLLNLVKKRHSHQGLLELSNEAAAFWSGQMRVTEPANRETSEKYLRVLYESSGCQPPKTVIWFSNPHLATLAVAVMVQLIQRDQYQDSSDVHTPYCVAQVSPVAAYIEKSKRVLSEFPALGQDINDSWAFGLPGFRQQPEYVSPSVRCCSVMMGPRRTRDIWDVISGRAVLETPDDVPTVLSHLSAGLKDIPESKLLKQCRPESLDLEYIGEFDELLLDRVRLGLVGYRSLLRSLGVCPHKDDGLEQILLNCGGFVPFDNFVIAVERPCRIVRDSEGRLHNSNGKSIEYADGWGCYSLQGLTVWNDLIVTNPEKITAEMIDNEDNVELRRVMIQTYGLERYLADCRALIVHQDECGILYKNRMRFEEIAVVKVLNKTAEPDGQFRTYFLFVPPHIQTAREAVAWTFDMRAEQYQPQVET